jgi:xanthine dehydrogenase large subunit
VTLAKPLPHDAAFQHGSGTARYVDDIPTPASTLHLAFGLSPVAKGEIKSLNLTAVRNVKGVHLVLEAKDLPFTNDVSPSAHDEPLLAERLLHYAGQPIFLVIAESHLIARKAAKMAEF